MDELTKNERVINVLKKNEVDRPPVSMWKHFFKEENSSNELAESMLSFQNKFNWDFMKVNPRFSYHTEDWGVKMKTYNDSFKSPDKIEYPIKQKSDWNKIKYLDIFVFSIKRLYIYKIDTKTNIIETLSTILVIIRTNNED